MSQVKHYAEKWRDEMGEHEVRAYIDQYGDIVLPHSCDEWRIGLPKHAEELISDLKKLIFLKSEMELK